MANKFTNTTLLGKAINLGRTFLTLFAIYRYFTGAIGKLKVYQSLADLPPSTNKLLSHHYLITLVAHAGFVRVLCPEKNSSRLNLLKV